MLIQLLLTGVYISLFLLLPLLFCGPAVVYRTFVPGTGIEPGPLAMSVEEFLSFSSGFKDKN